MTNDEKAAFIARIKKAQAAAAGRGLRIIGYEVNGDHIRYDYAPLKPKRGNPRPSLTHDPDAVYEEVRRITRGAALEPRGSQGSLL